MPEPEKSLLPTRKWIVAQVTAFGGLAAAWLEAGEFGTSLQIVGVGLLIEAVSTWLIPNSDTRGGVPLKT